MKFNEYIEAGIKKAGKARDLCNKINVLEQQVSNAKNDNRRLPIQAVFRLAQFLEVEPSVIIASQELALAKTEDKRKFWEEYLRSREKSFPQLPNNTA